MARKSLNVQKCELASETPSPDQQTAGSWGGGGAGGAERSLPFSSARVGPTSLSAASSASVQRQGGSPCLVGGGPAGAAAREHRPTVMAATERRLTGLSAGSAPPSKRLGGRCEREGSDRKRKLCLAPQLQGANSQELRTATDLGPAHRFLVRAHARTHVTSWAVRGPSARPPGSARSPGPRPQGFTGQGSVLRLLLCPVS